jgi:hypothetical protein
MIAIAKDAERRGDFETARYGYDSVLQLQQARAGGTLAWTSALGGSADVSENARKAARLGLDALQKPSDGALPSARRFEPSHMRAALALVIVLLLAMLYAWSGRRPSEAATSR